MVRFFSTITYLAFELNAALDCGKYDGITVAEVKAEVRKGSILHFLKQQLGDDADLSLVEGDPEAAAHFTAQFRILADSVDERRKLGMENRGICLLVGYLLEMAQHPWHYGFEVPAEK